MSRTSVEQLISEKVKMPAWEWIKQNCHGMLLPQATQTLREACGDNINIQGYTVYNIVRKAIKDGKTTEEEVGIVKGKRGKPSRKISMTDSPQTNTERSADASTATTTAVSDKSETSLPESTETDPPPDKYSGPFKVHAKCKKCNGKFVANMSPYPKGGRDVLLGIKASRCPKCGLIGSLICEFKVDGIKVIKTVINERVWETEDEEHDNYIQTEEFVDEELKMIDNPLVLQ